MLKNLELIPDIQNTQKAETFTVLCMFLISEILELCSFYSTVAKCPVAVDGCMSSPNNLQYAESFCMLCRTWISEYYLYSLLYILLFALICSKVHKCQSQSKILFNSLVIKFLPLSCTKLFVLLLNVIFFKVVRCILL